MPRFFSKCYQFYKVMKDKSYQKLLEYYHGTYQQTIRYEKIPKTLWGECKSLLSECSHIKDHIYVGNSLNACDKEMLQTNKIRYILNVTQEISNYFESDSTIHYLQIPILDNNDARIIHHIDKVLSFIKEAKDAGSNILIHCYMGSSRSATCALLYLMKQYGMTFENAYQYSKKKRDCINISQTFSQQLRYFEENIDNYNF